MSIFKSDEEHLQFESMDVGSLWITILAVSAVGVSASVLLNNIAAFIDKCYVIKSHQLTIKQQEVIYENMKIDQKTKEQYLDGLKLVYDQIVKSTVVELEEITNIKLEDGEQVGIVSQAFDKTISLLDKGLQIYTTIDTPKEVQNLFKPLEMKYVDVAKPIEKIVQKRRVSKKEKRGFTLSFSCLKWHKSTDYLFYNYGMRLEIYHLTERM